MTNFRLLLRTLARLVAFAMLCIALAPSLTPWLRATQGGVSLWDEICVTSGGVQLRGAQADDTARAFGLADRSEDRTQAPLSKTPTADHHCPWCTHLGGAWPPPQVQLVLAPATVSVRPERFYSAPHAVFAWASAKPRGPPILA